MISQHIIKSSESHERLDTGLSINALDVLNSSFPLQFSLTHKPDNTNSSSDIRRFLI